MKSHFHELMTQATGLVGQGQLKQAMTAIQAAMGGHAVEAAHEVIDVEAREVHAETGATTPPHQGGAFIAGSHTEKAGTRAYKLYIPPNHQDGARRPLIVMLHGCTQNPDDFAAGTRMNEAARQQGFFVLYPAQAQNANPSQCWNWFKHNHQQRDRGEPSILAGMTRQIMAQHAIDPQRVHVAGLSAGGAMAAILGQAYPDLFAAVGVHSGLPVGAATDAPSAFAAMKGGGSAGRSSPAGPPTIVFHGDRDSTVHPVNGERVAAAAQTGALTTQQLRDTEGRAYTRHVHANAAGRVRVEHWVVHGAGHAWSGGSAQGSYTDPQGPDATQAMLRFFKANPLGH